MISPEIFHFVKERPAAARRGASLPKRLFDKLACEFLNAARSKIR